MSLICRTPPQLLFCHDTQHRIALDVENIFCDRGYQAWIFLSKGTSCLEMPCSYSQFFFGNRFPSYSERQRNLVRSAVSCFTPFIFFGLIGFGNSPGQCILRQTLVALPESDRAEALACVKKCQEIRKVEQRHVSSSIL